MYQTNDENHYTLLSPVQDTLLKLTEAEANQNLTAYTHLVNQLSILSQLSFTQSDLLSMKKVNQLERNLLSHVHQKIWDSRKNPGFVDVLRDSSLSSMDAELSTLISYKCAVVRQRICMNGLRKTILSSQCLKTGDLASFELQDHINELLLDVNNVFSSCDIAPFNYQED